MCWMLVHSGEEVNNAELELLGRMLYFADQAYEGESEGTLNGRLAKLGAPRQPPCLCFGMTRTQRAQFWTTLAGFVCSPAHVAEIGDLGHGHKHMHIPTNGAEPDYLLTFLQVMHLRM